MTQFWLLLGRVLIGLLFVISGIGTLLNWEGVLNYIHTIIHLWELSFQSQPAMGSFFQGMHEASGAMAIIAVILQLVGGGLMMVSYHVKWAAGLLIAFLVPATLFCQPFWFFVGQDGRLQQMMFLKNLAILGGVLYVICIGSGSLPKSGKTPSS